MGKYMERRINGIPCDFEQTMMILCNGYKTLEEEKGFMHDVCTQKTEASQWFNKNKRWNRDYSTY